MHPKIEKKIEELRQVLIDHSPNAVSFSLFMNSQETEVNFVIRSAEQLNEEGTSMRNIAGEWIK